MTEAMSIPAVQEGVEGRTADRPTGLSPSRVGSFTSCPLQFWFSDVQRLPEPPGRATTMGTIVHRALELLFASPAHQRTPRALTAALDRALAEYADHPDYVGLRLTPDEADRFAQACRNLCDGYFEMEDPTSVRDIGLELRLSVDVGSLNLRGIIDRLELDEHGELVVTDYKTGRPPSDRYERKSLEGLQFYAFLCEKVLGRRPARIRLMYLSSRETIETTPTDQSVRFITTRTSAIWKTVERACETGDFRARRSRLCDFCSFRDWCPEFGGDPSRAAVEAPRRYAELTSPAADAA